MDCLKEGEWVKPVMHAYKLECCNCGLTHTVDFLVVDKESGDILNDLEVVFRAYRVNKRKIKKKKRK